MSPRELIEELEWDDLPHADLGIEVGGTYHLKESEIIEFTLPGTPLAGSQLKFNRTTGNAYRPKEHKQRVFTIYEYACNEVPEDQRPFFTRGVPLALGVEFYFPYRAGDYRTGKHAGELKPNAPIYMTGNKDLDNLLKPLKDGLKGVVYADDKQVAVYNYIIKKYSDQPRTKITLMEIKA